MRSSLLEDFPDDNLYQVDPWALRWYGVKQILDLERNVKRQDLGNMRMPHALATNATCVENCLDLAESHPEADPAECGRFRKIA